MTKLERNIMASIALIYVARRLTSRTALECYALFLSAFGITVLVSLSHVAANFVLVEDHGLPALGLFLLTAITKTNILVQLVLALGVIALVSLSRNLVRATGRRQFA